MRLSYRTHILKTVSDTAYGFYAEADFCAEHEHGLSRLYRDMACGDPAVEGIERYQPSQEAVFSGRFPVLGKGKFWYRDEKGKKKNVTRRFLTSRPSEHMPQDGYFPASSGDATVWFAEYGFLIMSRNEETDVILEFLADRAKDRDIAVFMGGGGANPFGRGGIVIVVPSLVSAEEKETLRKSHENTRLLEEAAVRTRIRERIRQKAEETSQGGWTLNSPYHLYGTRADWSNSIKSRGEADALSTKHDVIFWINSGRKIYGWYTVEELDQWLVGTGKVLEDAAGR
jgi:hypothetical protein